MTSAQIRNRLLAIVQPVKVPLILSTICRYIALLAGIMQLALSGWILGTLFLHRQNRDALDLKAALIGLVIVSVIRAVLRYLEQYAGHYVAFKSLAYLRTLVFDRLEPQAPAATDGKKSGDLIARVTRDVDRVEVFFAHTIAPVTTAVLIPITVIAIFWNQLPPPLLIIMASSFLILGLVVPNIGAKQGSRDAKVIREQRGLVAQHLVDSMQGIGEVLGFRATQARQDELESATAGVSAGLQRLGYRLANRRTVSALSRVVAMALFIAYGIHWFLNESHNAEAAWNSGALGALLVGLLSMFATWPALLEIEEAAADLDQAFVSAERLFSIIDAEPVVPNRADNPALNLTELKSRAGIRFQNVKFTYPGRLNAAVDDVTFEVAPGSFTGIVGASGSGKSTIAALALQFWLPDSGTIEVAGVDIRDFSGRQLRNLVTIVSQRTYLFNDTLAANLRLANPHATDDQLWHVCQQVLLDDWLGDRSGLQRFMGEGGEEVSGGQRQRIALARALLRETPIIVLDEITSQLDSATEAGILQTVAKISEHKTIISIAHRINTVSMADQILVMDRGQILEQGAPAQLLATPGSMFNSLSLRDI
ncbi:MAG: ABC transporter ATP-binding protein/permease [Kiritimatiellae bacterium]|nr:ABC transporter ATP-binding protein/permease [Kiritimatiellia bacterium]